MKVFFLSNGAGEDAIASRIIKNLQARGVEACAFPLVGVGEAYDKIGVEKLGPSHILPSQGLSNESLKSLGRDLTHGLLGHLYRSYRFLREMAKTQPLVVACGDVFLLVMCKLAGLKRVLFIGTAKSSYHHRYNLIERWLMRSTAFLSLVRDEKTSLELRSQGVRSDYVGNVMMDELKASGRSFEGVTKGEAIALFPGSRENAYEDFSLMMEVLQRAIVLGFGFSGLVAVAPSLEHERLVEAVDGELWGWEATQEEGSFGYLMHREKELRIYLLDGSMGDTLAFSSLAFGQAGTANEQAAGMGLPVLAVHSQGLDRLGWYRGRQKGLLGECLVVATELQEAAEQLVFWQNNPGEVERLGAIGRERMGRPGASQTIASLIESYRDFYE